MTRKTLGECADVLISGVDKKTLPDEQPVRLCNYTDVYYNWAVTLEMYDGLMKASAKPNEIEKFKLAKGQVALTKDSETREDIGIPSYIASDFDDVILGYHCALIKPDTRQLDGKYLNALLHAGYVKEYFSNNAGGSGQRYYLSDKNIKDLPLFLPAVPEQKNIGRFLSSIDRVIQLSRKRIENLEKLAKEIYDYWFVQFDFPDKNGKPYKSTGGKMVYNPQLKREIPEGWEVKRLDEIAEYASEKVSSDDLTVDCYVTTDSLCSGKRGREKASNLPPARCSLTAYQPYDTLVANIRPYLHKIWLADSEGGASNDVLVFRSKQKTAIGFLHELLWQDAYFDYMMSGAKGSKMPRGDKDHIMRYVFASPSDRLLDQYNRFCIPTFDNRSNIEKEIHELTQMREFLLPLLMNGQAKMGGATA